MRYLISFIIFISLLPFGGLTNPSFQFFNYALALEGKQVEQGEGKSYPNKLLNRIDFGNAYIIGQTIKSGAVYLMQRKKSDIHSMLLYRENYRKEILENFKIDGLNPRKQ